MPCHPHPFTRPCVALLRTTSALLGEVAGLGAVVRREAAHGIIADNLLTPSNATDALLLPLQTDAAPKPQCVPGPHIATAGSHLCRLAFSPPIA